MLIRKLRQALFGVVLCGLGGAFGAAAQNAPNTPNGNVSLSIPQARQVGANALRHRQPRFALQIADGLLQRDPKDAFAHFLIAKASQQLGKPRDGRRAAVRSFRFSNSDQDKFTSSQLAAQLAYQEKRLTLAQVWLRRSVNFVQTPQQREQVAKDYQRLRAENPWNTQLRFSIAPSSNANSGSDSAIALIEGLPSFSGRRRAADQALPGTVGVADLRTSYRFAAGAKQAAYLTGRFYTRKISLSSATIRRASAGRAAGDPDVRNSDYGSSTAELGLKYVLGAGKNNGLSTFSAMAGKSWYARKPTSTLARVEYEYSFSASKRTRLSFSGSHERRNYEASSREATETNGLRVNLRHKFERGDTIGLGLIARKTTSDVVNGTSNSGTAYLSYELASPIGPATLAFSAGATYYDFPAFTYANIPVPGGRQDTTTFASVVMAFEKVDYAGFTPTVTFRAQRNRSNVGILNSTKFSASIGIKSSF